MACIIHDVLVFQYPEVHPSSFSNSPTSFVYGLGHSSPPHSIIPLSAPTEISGRFEDYSLLDCETASVGSFLFFGGDCLHLFLDSPSLSSFKKTRTLLIKQMAGLLFASFPLEFWEVLG